MLTARPTDPAAPLKVALMSCAHTHASSYASTLDARADIYLVVADPDGYGDVVATRIVGSYQEAWDSTAGSIEGAQPPELPAPDECV